MIITITGKPCSGKSTVVKMFSEKYNFKYISTGDMFRKFAKEFGYDILRFQKEDEKIKDIDELVDTKIKNLGITNLNDDIIIDSRLAWHFIPNSFKVFIDISDEVAGERLMQADRETEKTNNLNQAMQQLKDRWNTENERYQEIYKIDNLNLNNYNLVINSNNLQPHEIVEIIYENYKKFIKNTK